jgi:hypothetical protein
MLCLALVLLQVLVAWIFFRATSLAQALHMSAMLFAFRFEDAREVLANNQYECVLVLLLAGRHAWLWITREGQRWEPRWWPQLEPIGWAVVAAACLVLRGPGRQFVYFQF